jgi:hypothetical protein
MEKKDYDMMYDMQGSWKYTVNVSSLSELTVSPLLIAVQISISGIAARSISGIAARSDIGNAMYSD